MKGIIVCVVALIAYSLWRGLGERYPESMPTRIGIYSLIMVPLLIILGICFGTC